MHNGTMAMIREENPRRHRPGDGGADVSEERVRLFDDLSHDYATPSEIGLMAEMKLRPIFMALDHRLSDLATYNDVPNTTFVIARAILYSIEHQNITDMLTPDQLAAVKLLAEKP
jgi:hypothetical protein